MKWLAILVMSPACLYAGGPVIIVPPAPLPVVAPSSAPLAQANQSVMNDVLSQLNRQQIQLSIAAAQTSPVYAQPFIYPRQIVIKPNK